MPSARPPSRCVSRTAPRPTRIVDPAPVQRRRKRRSTPKWPREPDDWYVEEEWNAARLFDVETFEGRILDPACGMGRIVKAARAAGYEARGSDLRKRACFACRPVDFFTLYRPVDNIVSNVPYKYAAAFVAHALALATRKVALLLPAGWQSGNFRSLWLEKTPIVRVWLLAPRPSMPPGPIVLADIRNRRNGSPSKRAGDEGDRPGRGTVDYAWYVWDQAEKPTGSWQTRVLRRDACANNDGAVETSP